MEFKCARNDSIRPDGLERTVCNYLAQFDFISYYLRFISNYTYLTFRVIDLDPPDSFDSIWFSSDSFGGRGTSSIACLILSTLRECLGFLLVQNGTGEHQMKSNESDESRRVIRNVKWKCSSYHEWNQIAALKWWRPSECCLLMKAYL